MLYKIKLIFYSNSHSRSITLETYLNGKLYENKNIYVLFMSNIYYGRILFQLLKKADTKHKFYMLNE